MQITYDHNSSLIFSWQHWRMDTDGWLPADLAARGVIITEEYGRFLY